MKKIKVGMISFAHAGHPDSYLSFLINHPNVEIIGLAHHDKERLQKHLDAYGLPYYANYEELLQTDCDAVIICSEYVNHAKIVMEAAEAKKHILCEKPLGLSIPEMRAMIKTCKENNVQLMTAFPSRFSKPIQEVKKMIDRGGLGEVLAIKGTNRGVNPGSWFIDPLKSGGGALMDHTVHVMDLMFWLTNSEVKDVYTEASTKFNDIDVEDAGIVHVTFNNGTIGVIDTSWSLHESFPRSFDLTLQITGTKGSIFVDALGQSNELYSKETKKATWEFWGDNIDQYLVNAFVHAIVHNEQVPITGEDGFNSTAVALATYESLRMKEPVDFNSFIQSKL